MKAFATSFLCLASTFSTSTSASSLAFLSSAAALAAASDESLATLRERVTSKGGTTYAALTSMNDDAVQAAIIKALKAAAQRGAELGKEFGQS